jgi:AraC-like DNA-binding protein
VSDTVREFVVLLLPRGHCRAKTVAQHLGVDRRTIAKYLAGEGTTFSALVDDVRSELLSRYVEDGVRPLAEVSSLLGFSDPSSFSRWHRNHFGVVARSRLGPRRIPLAWRK